MLRILWRHKLWTLVALCAFLAVLGSCDDGDPVPRRAVDPAARTPSISLMSAVDGAYLADLQIGREPLPMPQGSA